MAAVTSVAARHRRSTALAPGPLHRARFLLGPREVQRPLTGSFTIRYAITDSWRETAALREFITLLGGAAAACTDRRIDVISHFIGDSYG